MSVLSVKNWLCSDRVQMALKYLSVLFWGAIVFASPAVAATQGLNFSAITEGTWATVITSLFYLMAIYTLISNLENLFSGGGSAASTVMKILAWVAAALWWTEILTAFTSAT
jgi:hypothetical protein